ncbi:hypothetical protein D3C81_1801900 [compost metagenome]
MLLLCVAIQELPVSVDLGGVIQLHPQLQPHAIGVFQMPRVAGQIPAGELGEVAGIDLQPGEERHHHVFAARVVVRSVALGKAATGHRVEQR